MKLTVTRWHKGTRPPNHDGEYLAFMWEEEKATVINYTAEGGWNTHKDINGDISHINSPAEQKNWCGNVRFWANMPERGGVIDAS